jgi:hypothetical protein
LLAGVKMVKPIVLLERLFVRLGGLEKDWPRLLAFVVLSSDDDMGRDVVDAALDMTKAPDVLTARFFRFLPFRPGVVDRCMSKNGCDECIMALSEVCGLVMPNEEG